MASVTKLRKGDLVQMFREIGFLKAGTWDDDTMEEKLLGLPDYVLSDKFVEDKVEWTKEGKAAFDVVMDAFDGEGMISFRDDESPDSEGEKSDDEYDLEEDSGGDDEEEEAQEEKIKERVKRGRGRPPKPKPAPEYLAPHNGFAFTEVSAKLLTPTKDLAARFKDMTKFPRDRDFSERRADKILEALRNNEFRGSEWVSCLVEETGQTYRLNGKHTSAVVHKFLEEGGKLDRKVLVREYEAPTLKDAAGLFATMDTKDSSRTKSDVLRGYASTLRDTEALSNRLVGLATAGLAYGLYGKKYKKISTTDQAGLLLSNIKFARFVGSVLGDDALRKADPPKKARDVRHMMRMSVVASMYKTFRVDREAASDFWLAVRDDCNDEKNSPRRVLYRFLTGSKVGRGGKRVSEEEILVKCLQAWNAWRAEEKTVTFRWTETTPIPEVK